MNRTWPGFLIDNLSTVAVPCYFYSTKSLKKKLIILFQVIDNTILPVIVTVTCFINAFQNLLFSFHPNFLQFLKSSEQSPTTSESEHDQLENFEDEKLKLLKAWRSFLIVCSSCQV